MKRLRAGSRRLVVLAAGVVALGGCVHFSLLPQFEATLAAHDSATVALGEWCAARHLDPSSRISATPLLATDYTPEGLGALLDVASITELHYRRVRLSCGTRALSYAQNWYVPARLTPEMNAVLAGTDTPFGKVAAPLRFTRERLQSVRGRGPGCPSGTILTHRALLRLPDGRPLALVVECYTRANLR